MTEVQNNNVPVLSVGETVDRLADAYSAFINRKMPLSAMPSVMLWGPPGVGKSQAVREIADRIREATQKKVVVTDVRLLLFNPIDLRGIPTANEDKTLAVWLKPKIFQMDESDKVVNILFLDEISAAPQSVQAAAYQITLDRTVGEHKLPDNCIVMAAGNRVTDKSVAYKMPKALANRLLHLEVQGSEDAWHEWAVTHGIHEKVVGFLSFRTADFMTFDASNDDLAFATPRSWEMVSNVLTNITDDVTEVYPLIAGLVGTGIATEFRSWSKVYQKLPKMADIFAGKSPALPRGNDVLYALTASITAYAAKHLDNITGIANAIRYADKMPADFSAVLLKDFMYLDDGHFREKLLTVPEFARWLEKKGTLMNGNV